MANLRAVTRVLARRNVKIYFLGSFTAWTGLWMQRVAVEWLAWQLTHSPLWVGVMVLCNLGPSVLVSPFAGAAADRLDRVRLTQVTQLVTALQATTLAVLTLTGLIRVEAMAALEVVLGTAQAFAQPARQTLLPGMLPRADLPGGVALNSLFFNLARFAGPALAGPVIALWGVVPAMVANALAYLFASATLPLLRLDPATRRGHAPTASVWREAADGVAYVLRHPGIAPLFLFAASIGVLLRPIPDMLPPFIDQVFGRGAPGLATLSSTMGLAALCGGLVVAMRGRLTGLCRIALGGGLMLAIATAGFAATHIFAVAIACAALMGAATTVHGIAVQTLLQTATEGAMLGRVLSLWGMVVRGAPALGAVLFGLTSERFGLQAPVLAGAALSALAWLRARAALGRMTRALESGPTLA